jgi:hypothetical protein
MISMIEVRKVRIVLVLNLTHKHSNYISTSAFEPLQPRTKIPVYVNIIISYISNKNNVI